VNRLSESITYKKYDETEQFNIGDLVSFFPNKDVVIKSCTRHYKHQDKLVVGICIESTAKTVTVVSKGMVDVNVTGLICLGDKLTTSNIDGKARAVKYANDDVRIFDIRPIGKVVGLYNDYSKAKVLLDIE